MKRIAFLSGLISSLITLGIILPADSQVTSDGTINTTVRPSGNNFDILNGIQKGNNLFHSFQEFSIPTGSSATFNNSPDIVNIINRVTGGNISNIDGLIKANGNANLFLINPSGIVFGENASLNIGGSFLGTTADSILFKDGFEFSAVNPQNEPLLTVSVPLGLQMGQNPGKIEVQGSGHQMLFDFSTFSFIRDRRPLGLQVPSGKTLALIGGDISLQGGNLTAEGGRIELGSVSESAKLQLIPTSDGFTTGYDGISKFGDISFSQAASVEVSGEGAGNLQFQGRKISLVEESLIVADTLGTENGGLFTIKASESLEIIGGGTLNIFTGFITGVEFAGTGNAGDTIIETPQLSVMMPGGIISSATVGSGDAGNITLKVDNLTVRNGSYIQTATYADGNAANLNLIATKSVDIGRLGDDIFSFLASDANFGSSGDAGNLNITTPQLNLEEGSIFASTFGSGNSGDITLELNNLNMRGDFYPSQIATGTVADGNGGNLAINATDSIEITGGDNNNSPPTGLFSSAVSVSTGDAGDLTIKSNQINVRDGARISVNNLASGNTGNLNLNADNIFLDNQATLEAETIAGNQGNINLNSKFIQLRRNSGITTNATGTANGGNILINSPVIAGFENSNIIANAVEGNGGNINITTQGLFGLKFREQLTDQSDITASSEFGIDGTVQINNVGIEPSPGLVELPELINTDVVIANSCVARRNQQDSTFYITGKPGFPYRPGEAIPSDYSMFKVRTLSDDISLKTPASRQRKKGDSIVEATGIYRLENGELVFGRECQK